MALETWDFRVKFEIRGTVRPLLEEKPCETSKYTRLRLDLSSETFSRRGNFQNRPIFETREAVQQQNE